ncbi:polyferredoxin [Roseiarcus fermentans]|uniref:Polyferredoxin n=1 Tax=Roseiarcus fermentans TaxID=1473586 RepID=A0A366FEP5_9HYPH|nr:4Fe-4S binding protein [Roseiarcus fermentans]RBP12209.1 polyferredoxin [Roseiarcus fermentans]
MASQTSDLAHGLTAAPPRALPIAALGLWLRHHQRAIRRVQWAVIAIYAALLIVPALAPEPTRTSHIWSSVVLFAQFAFWGIWWPFVLVSMVLIGRTWCGVFCPEGALSEIVSARGLGRATPHWIKWRGWPFAAFVATTIYGQMVSVYQYPKPVLVILGGSTLAAMAVGFVYGRDKRVWCRYLCPVNGVFGLLAKLAPVHYAVDRVAWDEWRRGPHGKAPALNCAPLVAVRTMRGASACHMCGRCAGFKDAVALELRPTSQEVVRVAGRDPSPWETALIVFGLLGVAPGAFLWSSSPWLVTIKQRLAEWLVAHDLVFLLEPTLPWWILTNYPAHNDTLSPLDGALLVAYILATAVVLGAAILVCLAAAARALGPFAAARVHHLAQSLIPIAACGVFLGLSATTLGQLRADGLSLAFVPPLRIALLVGASAWSVGLAWSVAGVYARSVPARTAAATSVGVAVAISAFNWVLMFWIW